MSKGYLLLFGDITPEEFERIEREAEQIQRNAEQFQQRERYEETTEDTK